MPHIIRVPWVSIKEWRDVKQKFCSSDCQDWVRAFQLMLMWKARCYKLPANVECSLGIIQVLIQKSVTDTTNFSGQVLFSEENNLQLSFSTAIVRFVNHIMVPSKSSFYTAASDQNIPDWVVNLRHDVSHSAVLPPLSLLEEAADVAKQWLIDNYWTPQESEMSPVDGSALCDKKNETTPQIEQGIEKGLSCWLICRKRLEGDVHASVRDLSSAEFKSLVSLKKFLESALHFKGTKPFLKCMDSATAQQNQTGNRVSLQRMMESLHRFLLAISKRKNVNTSIVQSIFSAGFLRNGGKDLELWRPVLKILHEIDSMELLLEKLFAKLATGTDGERSSANDWLLVLLPLFESVQKRWRAHRLGNAIDEIDVELSIRKPPRLRYENFRKALINLDPMTSSAEVASGYAKFLSQKIGKEASSSMAHLVKLYTSSSFSNADDVENYSMHSIDDLITAPLPAEKDQVVPGTVEDSIWTEVEIDVEEWHKCPIGLLPHQKEPNLTLPDLVWVSVPPRKRKSPDDLFGWDE